MAKENISTCLTMGGGEAQGVKSNRSYPKWTSPLETSGFLRRNADDAPNDGCCISSLQLLARHFHVISLFIVSSDNYLHTERQKTSSPPPSSNRQCQVAFRYLDCRQLKSHIRGYAESQFQTSMGDMITILDSRKRAPVRYATEHLLPFVRYFGIQSCQFVDLPESAIGEQSRLPKIMLMTYCIPYFQSLQQRAASAAGV
ncbi:uncharacterized protein PADG_11064 [Paracoccidioides brasiliensis Pb18]|uniref:Uncharacterized protein n=1 Tax=Paracoccidioides brasiliensis (strain Pb18) TaxID=502780 RepID=A0A0A0HTU5_PARBD|nr:uncharacterized protein PADG_11064 [Paracoccidioides brasiliensis Pb18]KGM92614.1 hypothetical protein PADG_11064 [Paracoccidioides brasiliensis Pb18]